MKNNSLLEKRKKQQQLFLLFFIILGATFLILYFGFFKKEKVPLEEKPPLEISVPPSKIEINLEVLEHPIFKELLPLPQIEPIDPAQSGRENPFILYQK